MLQGKKLSILGDSLSTYRGISNDAAANVSTCWNPCYYRNQFPPEHTYWGRVMTEFGLTLCVNNSWSGGNLSGRSDLSAGVNRAHRLARNDGTMPDVIIVCMGINDLGRNVPVEVFASDYERTLQIIRQQYPAAMVCCVNLPDRDVYLKRRAEQFNEAIAQAVETVGDGCFIADFFHSRMNNDTYYWNTLDGLHPDADGMGMIAEVVCDAIRGYLAKMR